MHPSLLTPPRGTVAGLAIGHHVFAGDMTAERVAKARELNQDDFGVGIGNPWQAKTVSGMADANSIKPARGLGLNRQGARYFPGLPAIRAAV
jgi:hypothetical protein